METLKRYGLNVALWKRVVEPGQSAEEREIRVQSVYHNMYLMKDFDPAATWSSVNAAFFYWTINRKPEQALQVLLFQRPLTLVYCPHYCLPS